MASRLFSFPLVTAEEIENSPTVRGRPNHERKAAAGEEHQLRKKAIVAIFNAFQEPAKEEEERRDPASRGRLAESDKKDTRAKLVIGPYIRYLAAIYFLRFFSRRSMDHNTPLVIAAASLFLACKAWDEPVTHTRVAAEIFRAWFGRDSKEALAKLGTVEVSGAGKGEEGEAGGSKAGQQQGGGSRGGASQKCSRRPTPYALSLYSAVVDAEYTLLATLGFDFDVRTALTIVGNLLLKLPRLHHLRVHKFQQYCVDMLFSLITHSPTLFIEYEAHHLSLAVIDFVLKCLEGGTGQQAYAWPAGGQHWYAEEGLPVELHRQIEKRLIHLFPQSAPALAFQAAQAAAKEEGSTCGAPASPSSALDGVLPSTDTSVALSPSSSGQELHAGRGHLQAAAAVPSVGCKRGREEDDSLARHPEAPAPYRTRPAAQCPGPAAAAAAAVEDAELEEGEIEEGEIV